VSIAQRVRR
jgi:hypothetical protein